MFQGPELNSGSPENTKYSTHSYQGLWNFLKVFHAVTLMLRVPSCIRCVYYRPLEDRLGYCKIFQCTENARANETLCGKSGKWFKDQVRSTCDKNSVSVGAKDQVQSTSDKPDPPKKEPCNLLK